MKPLVSPLVSCFPLEAHFLVWLLGITRCKRDHARRLGLSMQRVLFSSCPSATGWRERVLFRCIATTTLRAERWPARYKPTPLSPTSHSIPPLLPRRAMEPREPGRRAKRSRIPSTPHPSQYGVRSIAMGQQGPPGDDHHVGGVSVTFCRPPLVDIIYLLREGPADGSDASYSQLLHPFHRQ